MKKPTIGIRQADGSFYPIMDESIAGKKRLVLTAAKADQASVKIDLYRSEDGTLDVSNRIGTLALEQKSDLTLQDIELILDIDENGRLDASASLKGSPERQSFSVDLHDYQSSEMPAEETEDDEPRSDQDILADESLDQWELDSIEESSDQPSEEAELAKESATLDLPEMDDFPDLNLDEPAEAEGKSDSEILSDDTLAEVELDDLNLDGPTGEVEAPENEVADLNEFSMDEDEKPLELDDAELGGADLGNADLGDLNMDEFSVDEEASSPPMAESLDEPMESPVEDLGDFSMNDEDEKPLELDDAELGGAELGDLNMDEFSMDDGPELSQPSDQLDELPELDTDLGSTPDWNPDENLGDANLEELSSQESAKAKKADAKKKKEKEKKAKAEAPRRTTPASPAAGLRGAVDKTSLLLSLATLGLLVMTILVLLFMNMIKTSPTPAIKPEVMNWNPPSRQEIRIPRSTETLTLNFSNPSTLPDIQAPVNSILVVPEELRDAKMFATLLPGDSPADLARRLGLDVSAMTSDGKTAVW